MIAAYARYSSDQQSAASLDDQLRNIRAWCQRNGMGDPVVFQDAAMSGARNDRPGYQALLASGASVIVVDDLSRLSRDSVEVASLVRRLRHAGVRLIGVSDGVDTDRKGYKIEVSLRGLMGELYLDELREKTIRGLTGRALSGSSAGGLPYGYRVTETGQRAICDDQAAVVRRIYADYLSGMSAREIAAGLNRDGIVSPRGKTWAQSAIFGDHRRGIGILANPIYAGRQIWNRSQWVKHPDTGKRNRRERPESEWVTTEHPELAIVERSVWDAAQRRAKGNRRETAGGRPARYLLSGILRCGGCGGPMVIVDRYRYGCATAKDRGTCTSRLHVDRRAVESVMLAEIRTRLLSDDAFQRFQRAAAAELRRQAPNQAAAKLRLAHARTERDNIMAAIRAGIITPSTKAALQASEAAMAAAERESQATPAQVLPGARERWRKLADTLGDQAQRSAPAREALRALIGRATLKNDNGPIVEIEPCQIAMVAGAGFGLYLTEPLRIRIATARRG